MLMNDGKIFVETKRQDDVKIKSKCTRWDELKETIKYHAQLSALLKSPTKFILLNPPTYINKRLAAAAGDDDGEWSIGERGIEYIQDDLNQFMKGIDNVQPRGVTPLTQQLQRIYESVKYLTTTTNKIILVIATDGIPTDCNGYTSPTIEKEFEYVLRLIQSVANVVIRLCTKIGRASCRERC